MGQLTTHVLDTAQGKPAAGMAIQLWRVAGDEVVLQQEAVTNEDGRVDGPLLDGDAFGAGTYQLIFAVGEYFAGQPVSVAEPAFLDVVTIRFSVANADDHYHVPLLISPWAYSTYRGR
ncbi:MAG: hydroxyisourate hydrolase [Thermomicrobiales bacterium]